MVHRSKTRYFSAKLCFFHSYKTCSPMWSYSKMMLHHIGSYLFDSLLIFFLFCDGFLIRSPSRSPDKPTCKFFIWGFIKGQVYRKKVSNIQEPRLGINEAFTNNSDIIRHRVWSELLTRIDYLFANNGGHVEILKLNIPVCPEKPNLCVLFYMY